ncbi:ion channel [Bacillus sp. THAF10]|uniref:ion channel n=1 Tax=Bacillus sp. THAF10 TaxID=2587848 RepID=UPI0012696EA4
MVTSTTVGYGEISPKIIIGRLIAVFLIDILNRFLWISYKFCSSIFLKAFS